MVLSDTGRGEEENWTCGSPRALPALTHQRVDPGLRKRPKAREYLGVLRVLESICLWGPGPVHSAPEKGLRRASQFRAQECAVAAGGKAGAEPVTGRTS